MHTNTHTATAPSSKNWGRDSS